jgi:hypothetical protein
MAKRVFFAGKGATIPRDSRLASATPATTFPVFARKFLRESVATSARIAITFSINY